MAPVNDDDFYDEEEDIDFSDLKEQYEVRLEEGLDAFVVVDGLPVVPQENKSKLVKFLLKKLMTAGRTSESNVFMPMGDDGQSQGFAFVEYQTPEQALAACKKLNGMPLDKKHTIMVNKLTDIERYGREGRIDDKYVAPEPEEFVEKEHLRSWLGDPNARDQFVQYRGDNVGVFWNKKNEAPEMIIDRPVWTESFVAWSPLGTYLTSLHTQGVQLWGGASWKRLMRFIHPLVNLIDFSPNEKYLVTWSNKPIVYQEGMPNLTPDEDGKHFIIWDVTTGRLLRSFGSVEAANAAAADDKFGGDKSRKTKMAWPLFKWSADDKYCARVTPGQSISIYETPSMALLDKKAVKVDGVVDFEWSPHAPTEEDTKKKSEQLLAYWTPEMNNQTARVALMAVPSKEVVRTRNLFNVSDCRLFWQSEGKYLCVKVDRHTKTKKSTFTSLEIFRIKEKDVPIEVFELKDIVMTFAWEPKGDRFVLITTMEVPQNAPGAPAIVKTAVSFYCPEKVKTGVGNFRHIRTVDKKSCNAIFWAPKGRFVVVATLHSQQNYELEFWDFDYEGEKKESEKDLSANLQLLQTTEHFGVTDIEWDPTGRYVATSASAWKHSMENGYHLWDFKGQLLREEHIDRFKQFLWRPRPPTMLSKEQQKKIRKNLREYSKIFDEEDLSAKDLADKDLIESRKRQLDEWRAWRARVEQGLREERKQRGMAEDFDKEDSKLDNAAVIEEIVEEVISEHEEEVA